MLLLCILYHRSISACEFPCSRFLGSRPQFFVLSLYSPSKSLVKDEGVWDDSDDGEDGEDEDNPNLDGAAEQQLAACLRSSTSLYLKMTMLDKFYVLKNHPMIIVSTMLVLAALLAIGLAVVYRLAEEREYASRDEAHDIWQWRRGSGSTTRWIMHCCRCSPFRNS